MLINCALCKHKIDTSMHDYTHMGCGHALHVQCTGELFMAGRFRCVVCRPQVPQTTQRLVDVGGDAAHSERVAAALRADRNDQVSRLRGQRYAGTIAPCAC
jgi:hypothetical protein